VAYDVRFGAPPGAPRDALDQALDRTKRVERELKARIRELEEELNRPSR